jgi:hypothetical protein
MHIGILAEQTVHDRVARDRRGAVTRECRERFGLTGSDPAGDRDRRCSASARY